MAAPSYTTDLTTIVDFDNDSPTVAEPNGWSAGRSPINNDEDFPIQSAKHGSLTMNTTGKAGIVATGPSHSWTSGDYLFGWIIWLAPGAIATQSSGGLVMIAGSSSSNHKVFYVGGSDFGLYPYGGWQNFAVDPEMTADETQGTATDFHVVGGGANVLSKVNKGNPLGIDVFRYGRGELRVASGESGNYATFSGMASSNDASSARWGLFQAIENGYKFKGLMVLGYGSAVDFVDENVNIVVDNTEYVQSDFNAIEIRNASSSVDWTNVSIVSLSTTSPGTFEVVDNATVSLKTCSFVNMSTFDLLSNTTATNCTWRGCGLLTYGGATMTGSSVSGYEGTAGTAATKWDVASDPNGELDDMSFEKGTADTHAIEFGSNTPSTISLSGHSYTSYNSTTGSNPTANSGPNDAAIYNNSGKALTINIVGGGEIPSVRNGAGATTTVVLSKSYTLTNIKDQSEVTILDRDVSLLDITGTNAGTPFGDTATTEAVGQSFQVSTAGKVERIRIELRKVGSPTDKYRIKLVNGVPGSTVLLTSGWYDGTDLTTSFVEHDIDLDGKTSLATSTTYGIEIERSGSVDASNYYEVAHSTTSVHSSGTYYEWEDGSGWSTASGDLLFSAMEAASDNSLFHVESVTTGTATYTHGGVSKTIEVIVSSLAYKQLAFQDSIGSTDKTQSVVQTPDLVYANP